MELNDEADETREEAGDPVSGDEAAADDAAGTGPEEPQGADHALAEQVDETETGAEARAAASEAYSTPYEPEDDGERQSLLRRLSPYLTVAGILLILRIVVYSFRRRRR